MTKKRATSSRSKPMATEKQIERIDELGAQLYGPEEWQKKRQSVVGRPLTPTLARDIIRGYQVILGGKV